MDEVRVASPDGKVALTILPNAERVTYTVTIESTPVVEPSPIVMDLDSYDLSTGVVLKNTERYSGDESYAWYGAKSLADDRYNGARLTLTNDLTSLEYTLDIRAFNDGVAFRHVIPGPAGAARIPDEYSTFTIPQGSTVWYGGLADGHYETPYFKKTIADDKADMRSRLQGARALVWALRCAAGEKIDITCLALGPIAVLHMPGELFVEYQLAAQKMRPDSPTLMAAYGDYGPGYIGLAHSYSEKNGYETGPVSRVAPEVEGVLMSAMRELLQ
jgi:hypothetical protein